MSSHELNILQCPSSKGFADKVFRRLKKRNKYANLIDADFVRFKNTEMKCVINNSIRGSDVFIFNDVANMENGSVNDNLVELLTAIDSVNHASAEEVNVVIPTFPYSRQHKKTKREGLTAALWCHILENMRVKRVITLDIHSREIQNAFTHTTMENLHASYQLIKAMKDDGIKLKDLVVVAPDSGAIERNKFFASHLQVPLAMMYKERDYSKTSDSMVDNNIVNQKLLGNVNGNPVLICDDMIDTGSTIIKAAKFLKEQGAPAVYMAVSLPFFNGKAIDDFEWAHGEGAITKVYGTNAVYNKRLQSMKWYKAADVSDLFADTIWRISEKLALSDLLETGYDIQQILHDKVD